MDGSIDSFENSPVDPDPHAPTGAAADERPDLRMQRLGDYLKDALAHPNAFAANLGAQNSGLMKMAYRIQQGIEDAMEQEPTILEDLENLTFSLDTYLKLSKQVDRFSQLCMKLDEFKAAEVPLATTEP